MSEFCRLCSSPLRGSRRKWLFGGSGSLPALFSQVLGSPVSRAQSGSSIRSQPGKGRPEDAEFLCGKCCHTLNIYHQYDLVLSRMRQLYTQRSSRLLTERDKLCFTLRTIHARGWGLPLPDHQAFSHRPGLSSSCYDIHSTGYYKNLSPGYQSSCPNSPFPDRHSSYHGSLGSLSSGSPTKSYQKLLDKDRSLWEHESWWEDRGETCSRCAKGDKCHSCSSWRVSDANYDVVCTVPRKKKHGGGHDRENESSVLLRSKSLGSFGGRSSSRGSVLSFSTTSLEQLSLTGEEEEMGVFWEPQSLASSPPPPLPRSSSPSFVLGEALRNLKEIVYSPLKTPTRSKIPVKKKGQDGQSFEVNNRIRQENGGLENRVEDTDGVCDEFMVIGSEVCRTQVSRFQRIQNTLKWFKTQLETAQKDSTSNGNWDTVDDQQDLVRELVRSLKCKDEVLEDCLALLLNANTNANSVDPTTAILETLRKREQELKAKEEERAEEMRRKEEEIERLRVELKVREEDVGRLAKVLRENQDTLTALRDLLDERDFAVQQLEVALDSAVRTASSQDTLRVAAVREKDALVTAMQGALSSSNQDVEALADSLLSQGLDDLGGPHPSMSPPAPLLAQLQEKGSLLSQALSDNHQQNAQHQRDIQDLLNALAESQTLLQKQLGHCKQRLQAGAEEQKTLRDALRAREAELREEKQSRVRDAQQSRVKLTRLHGAMRERDQVAQKLLQDAQTRDQTIKRLQETLSPAGMKEMLFRLP